MAKPSGNVLYYGDNLDVLRRHVPDESVDLVYLDPPFSSKPSKPSETPSIEASFPAVRVGRRRVRIRQSALDAFLEAGSQTGGEPAPSEPAPEVDEGSVTAWATFGAAMAETTAVLEGTD